MIVVVVRMPSGREIFVNGDYDTSRGVSTSSLHTLAINEIVLSPGAHKFEALDSQGRVCFRAEIPDDGKDNCRIVLDLDPVHPPELTS